MIKVHYMGWDYQVTFQHYANDRLAIQLVTEQGEPMAMATVNVPCYPLQADEVLIKSYAENEGMLECLSEAGIIEPTGKMIQVGQAVAHVCKLKLTDALKASMH